MTQWHIFYRTMGMAARNEKGWARADILAETKEDAVRELRSRKHRVQHIRVYPGEVAWVAELKWEAVTLETKHKPHEVVE